MGGTLIISHDGSPFNRIVAQLPTCWVSDFDEVGFFSKYKDFHDELDEWLIEQSAEECISTLLFESTDEALEHIGECVSNGEEVKVVSIGSDLSGAIQIKEAYPEVILLR